MNIASKAYKFYIEAVRAESKWAWGISQFYIIPNETHFLRSKWYQYRDARMFNRELTILQYLDRLVREIKTHLSRPGLSEKRKCILKDFLEALYNNRLREEIILFLEKADISEKDIHQVWEKIHAAWRMPEEEQAPVLAEGPAPVPDGDQAPVLAGEAPPELYAKTYVIAAHIFFELAGKEEEYEALSHQLGDLGIFIRDTFHIQKLPGTFSKLKGYSYKKVLEGKNTSKKGQIRPCLRQIIEHPFLFGEDISDYALQLLHKHFED